MFCFLFFITGTYLLGDSAFTPLSIMIPVYKTPPGDNRLSPWKDRFISAIAKARVRSEHYIDLLKGRFSYLKGMRIRINTKKEMIKVNRIITVSANLHNLMIFSEYDEEWITYEEEEVDDNPNWSDDDSTNNERIDQQLN